MKKVHVGEVESVRESASAAGLSERVQEALGELVGAAREGLLALSVGVGLGVLHELMDEEVQEVCGPRGKHDSERVAYRHGSDDGEVTLGSRRVPVSRPRMRAKDGGGEVGLSSYEHFARRDALGAVVLERMLAGVSTRRFPRTQEPVGERVEAQARSTSKSSISRTFIARTAETLAGLMSRKLEDVRLAVLMLDGVVLKDHTNVVALGITTQGVKIPLGLWEGSTENKTVATSLLTNLVARGLEIPDGHTIHYDESGAIIAITLLNVRRTLEREGHLTLSLPVEGLAADELWPILAADEAEALAADRIKSAAANRTRDGAKVLEELGIRTHGAH